MSEPRITAELASFLESGLALHVATRDQDLSPECCIAVAIRVQPDRNKVDLFLPTPRSNQVLANLRDNGLIAFTAAEAPTHRTVQLKGRLVSMRPESEEDRRYIDPHLGRAADLLDLVGVPLAVSRRVITKPTMVVTVEIAEIYQQTPGPDAGAPLLGSLR